MSLEVIYVTRHGFRSNWVVDPQTGDYSTTIPSPTGIPSDPALAGYGVDQSRELATHLSKLDPPIERFYSSPFYRCLQTLNPTLDVLERSSSAVPLELLPENGIGEWYGTARFDHPSPADVSLLKKLFPRVNDSYTPSIRPSVNGESISDLHDRTAFALSRIIDDCDRAGIKAIVLCTHAATLIAIGRALTGRMPEDVEAEDFRPFTCSLSTFKRRAPASGEAQTWSGKDGDIPHVPWRNGAGVGGGWNLEVSGDCSFLSGGEERGWRFSGDESFSAPATAKGAALDAGTGLGVVIEGKKPKERTLSASSSSRL